MPNFISEDDIELALLQKLQHVHGFDTLDCYTADAAELNDESGRVDKRKVILEGRLSEAAYRLNPNIPKKEIDRVLVSVLDMRKAMSLVAANREVYGLIRDGIPLIFEDDSGTMQSERVQLIDFNDTSRNRYLAVRQLWIKGERRFRRPDVILYVNGLPLVMFELKNSNVKLKSAYDDNLTRYKDDIPQLFLANAFCVLSNAIETRIGSITSEWEHFFHWLRPDDEKEKVDRKEIRDKGLSLERLVNGLCRPDRLLDYIENFIVYYMERNKIIAQNHQFIGVNNAYEVFRKRENKKGKLGVFWHTQGSGKSFSMIFYSRKIFRKVTGNFTFVIVTDREDLDGQIYRNFLNTETTSKADAAQPKDSTQLKRFLNQNKRFVFTLIQKFRENEKSKVPMPAPRDDIIVIVDEAHRTQYKSLAETMRAWLPKAQYLAFTGTPLLGRVRKTNKWFGDYVSEYNFQQSMDDGATVPLFYKKRVPQVLIQNEDLSSEFYEILEDENLDDAQQAKLEKKYSKETEVIIRDDRLETIAQDIVYHFPNRGYLGKGIVISLDKFTAVKMYDKVQRLWKGEIKSLRGEVSKTKDEIKKERMKQKLDYMRKVEMAVIVSEEAGEEKKFDRKNLDIRPHRTRMCKIDNNGHDIEHNFKDPENPLQLVFVCAMWLTGFDAPTVSTLYLDKPMKGHTLMQAIARANRVTSYQIDGKLKANGEIVDYYNVFRRMKKALKDYGQGDDGTEGVVPEKDKLFELLNQAIDEGLAFCESKGVHLSEVSKKQSDAFERVGLFKNFANLLLEKDEWRKSFNVYENTITCLYEACKPEILGKPIVRQVAAFQYLRGVIDNIIDRQDVDDISIRVSQLLDESVVVDSSDPISVMEDPPPCQIVQKGRTWDLSKVNYEKLQEEFKQSTHKNIEITDLRAFIEKKLEEMLDQNVTRADFAQRLQDIINNYNSGTVSAEQYFDDLMQFSKELHSEAERHVREGLTEDELELFDILKKPKMTKEETLKVKLAAKKLLHRFLEESPKVLVQDWYKESQSRLSVKSAIEEVLDHNLPNSYDRTTFSKACDSVLDTMINYAATNKKWAS